MAIVLGIVLLLQVLVVSVGDEAATYGTGRHHRRRWSVTQTILGEVLAGILLISGYVRY